MTHIARKIPTIAAMVLLSWTAVSAAEEASWTIVLHPTDFVIGDALGQLHTRRQWNTGFDEQFGGFEVALRKEAVAIAAPRCQMDYLILTIPHYYPENPKQASVRDRRAVYDALVALQTRHEGSIAAGVEAPEPLSHRGSKGTELAACNLYFALPLSVRPSAQ
jgi:hypothetical protein